ncbi:MAG: DNA polymerase III subunit gamma/tau [Firmicutes bacterium]|nr:DNA polymerase III subunit gamma/tau [Bacillota bacterium]
MARLALYREERPRTFAEVVGQEHVTRTLRNALAQNRFTHAYLFCGPRGTGKTSCARILAKAVNCLHPRQGEPCNQCRSCELIQSGQSMDVIEIDAASNRGIDEIRDLRDKVKFAPTDLRYKVYIIDEVHMLTEPAFNALLKTLEEPPAHVIFVLATTEVHKVPVTIRSRCQRYDFHRLSTRQIAERLAEVSARHGFQVTEEALYAIARQAEGGMRDALSLLDQVVAYAEEGRTITLEDALAVLGAASLDRFLALDEAIRNRDPGQALLVLDQLVREGKDLRQLVRDLMSHFRDLLLLQVPGGEALLDLPEETLAQLRQVAAGFDSQYLLWAVKFLAGVENDLRLTTNPRLVVEVGLIRLCSTPPAASGAPSASAGGEWVPPAPQAPGPGRERRGAPAQAAAAPGPGSPAGRAGTQESGHRPQGPEAGARSGAAAQAPGPVSPELAAMQQAWPRVVEFFRNQPKAKSMAPLVAQATPVRLEGRTLVLGFPPTPEGRTARDLVHRRTKWVEAALNRLGLPEYLVTTTILEPGETAEPAGGLDLVNLIRQRVGPGVPVEVKEDE